MKAILFKTGLALALATFSAGAVAHGGAKHQKAAASQPAAEQKPWGIAGKASEVSRTVEIRMSDAMRFEPDAVRVKQGETLRFVLHNDGAMIHEMIIGTKESVEEHATWMKKFPDMEHDEPWMAHVAPRDRGEIVWKFNHAGECDFACLIPGHYEAGMRGKILVIP